MEPGASDSRVYAAFAARCGLPVITELALRAHAVVCSPILTPRG